MDFNSKLTNSAEQIQIQNRKSLSLYINEINWFFLICNQRVTSLFPTIARTNESSKDRKIKEGNKRKKKKQKYSQKQNITLKHVLV